MLRDGEETPSRCELLTMVKKHSSLLGKTADDASDVEMDPRFWHDVFDLYFLRGKDSRRRQDDDLVFFVRKLSSQGFNDDVPPYFVRRWAPKLDNLIGEKALEVDWRRSFHLNLIAHTTFTVTVAICSHQDLRNHQAEQDKPLSPIYKVVKTVYASPSRVNFHLDSQKEVETTPAYPDICFAVDDFDSTFDAVVLTETDHCYCVILNAHDGAAFPTAKEPDDCSSSDTSSLKVDISSVKAKSSKLTLFSGFVSYQMVRDAYDAGKSRFGNLLSLAHSPGKQDRLYMKGPGGHGEVEVAVSGVVDQSQQDTGPFSPVTSKKGFGTASSSISATATHSWRRPPKLNPTKSLKTLHFLFNSTSSNSNSLFFKPSLSSSTHFPLSLRPPPDPLQFHPLNDSVQDNLVENLENSIKFQVPISEPRIFIQDPPWIASLFLKGMFKKANKELKLESKEIDRRKYNLLRRRQIKAETEAWEKMVEEYKDLERVMREKKLAPSLPYVKALFLGWFEPLREAIAKEQKAQQTKKHKQAFAPHIDLLPADKMALIVMHKLMGLVMMGNQDGCVQVVQAAVHIGMAIEQEIRIHSFLEKSKSLQRKKTGAADEDGLSKEKEILRKRVNGLIRRKRLVEVQKLLKKEDMKPWGRDTQAKLGSRLIELLTETAHVQPPLDQLADGPPDVRPAFRHRLKAAAKSPGQKLVKNYGVIECDPLVLAGLDKTAKHMLIPYVPMLVPPKRWKGYDKGGHLFLPSYVMRTHGSRKQVDTMRNIPGRQMQKVFEALDMLGSTKWRINKKVLNVVESIWARGGNIAGLVDREDVPVPEKPPSEDPTEIQEWRWSARKAKKLNQERHSQRCDTELKLSVARRMKDEDGFYYPHNLDFRGRAYPMHPHLNHLSSDLCRGVLEFAEGRPLGKSGLRWLKIHLANLYSGGVEKLSYDGRISFVVNHIDDIFDSATNPVNGNRWWLTAEDPLQCLAACINLSEALNSPSPHTVISHLPIHQDGSCNGLQHYAALGRDTLEAAAVNLVAGEKPADVYSEIAVRVHDIMKRDSNKDPTTSPNALLARVLVDQIDRKLVKQTVMTSVYGVTYVGAREQIKRRLEEKGLITDDRLLFTAACYAAKVTLAALGEIFQAARGIMSWLGDCAKVIASENQPVRWTTPLGLPVVQPYCKSERHLIRTSLQVLALQRESNLVDVRKQRTAFPPNFVHSLDGSHMMMTALACRDAGIRFAGVHDSFWTHACDVDQMNQILRENFVELYSKPILENLLKSFQAAYPELTFPPLPERGDFDLQEVLKSPYFFN